ncbi:ATP-binding protein [Aliiroseovarius sp. xm-a-151]|uniref:ATP-binding protein n=1 Tax=unclassified Aliiroseovarius TaxID=2623558 RepID=UPI0019E76782|nr:Insertion sequence IS5376 putative ATP-binding protein [Aliiroseovarius sp. xm-d-517]NRP42769.1 Insertion sequence IS5376 putative ATP-binding protein [Aliiroseovarius sp. xm-m-339-2]NRP63681.1 Insertion sequence IS5376 putative ATP-binding protein [Aliiroseovarius sp. xm-a-151]
MDFGIGIGALGAAALLFAFGLASLALSLPSSLFALKAIERTELLILDDWGLSVLTPTERRDLLEILDDRQGRGSTIVTSQLPVDQWFEVIGDPTLADAILDRLVHNAHRLTLTGDSMRRKMSTMKTLDQGVAP